ncbi:SDR family oxidoreductase [Paenibacillus sp. NEAU-GSW1]|uniref:SDR family oxidoreductase n=1 Tax=Paenibacillus sp. NEAU-GSW1 TaxID=2682486 RepID=UPI0012E2BD84|nr:SDR family oxidoreductase [Paenibacillus sp. NEAU-GSW1]MUT65353.1 SDR family NAD(P)-dependent oxidoreductase [Paenibacillus sp. NEAU-GSW1]
MKILITGANRGLGLAIAAEACARGHVVLAGVRSTASAGGLDKLSAEYPGQLHLLPLDVNDESSVQAAAAQAAAEHGNYIDAVINSAAILLGREQKLEQLDFGQVEQTMQTNLYGPMRVMKHFLPLLQRGERQCVMNISSEAGSIAGAYGGDYSYALSKSALNMFSAQLRGALSPQGMLVYALHPGWIRTDMGGGNAPGDAAVAAAGIMSIVDRTASPQPEALFITHKGQPMPH